MHEGVQSTLDALVIHSLVQPAIYDVQDLEKLKEL